MSHANATVELPDGTVFHAEYNGTVDIARPSLFLTWEEVRDQWRQRDDRKCTCGQPGEPAYYHTNYGDGFGWDTEVCRTCMVVVGDKNQHDQYRRAQPPMGVGLSEWEE